MQRAIWIGLIWTGVIVAWWSLSFRSPSVKVQGLPGLPVLNHNRGVISFDGEIDLTSDKGRFLSIKADDCVQSIVIDAEAIYSGSCKICQHCAWTPFFIPDHVAPGNHKIHIEVENIKGPFIFDMGESLSLGWLNFIALLLLGWGLPYLLPLSHSLALMLAAIAATLYFRVTTFDLRSYDVFGHIEYIRFLQTNWRLPALNSGWETYHPPLYYAASGFWLQIINQLGFLSPLGSGGELRILQAFSLFWYLLTLLVAAIALSKLTKRQDLHWLGTLVFALVPAHIYFVTRINNDVLLPLFGILSTMLVLTYWQSANMKTAFVLGMVTALALAVKMNGIILWAGAVACIIVGTTGVKFWPLNRKQILHAVICALPGAIFLLCWMCKSYYETGSLLYTNAAMVENSWPTVPNDAYKFFSFDFRAYLTELQSGPWQGNIRLSFLTYLLSTYLAGEFAFPGSWGAFITYLRVSFLPVFLCLCLVLASWRRHLNYPIYRASFIFTVIQLAFLALLAAKQPFACSMDARYLAPAYFQIGLLIAIGITDAVNTKGWRRGCAMLGIIMFPALLIGYYGMLAVSEIS